MSWGCDVAAGVGGSCGGWAEGGNGGGEGGGRGDGGAASGNLFFIGLVPRPAVCVTAQREAAAATRGPCRHRRWLRLRCAASATVADGGRLPRPASGTARPRQCRQTPGHPQRPPDRRRGRPTRCPASSPRCTRSDVPPRPAPAHPPPHRSAALARPLPPPPPLVLPHGRRRRPPQPHQQHRVGGVQRRRRHRPRRVHVEHHLNDRDNPQAGGDGGGPAGAPPPPARPPAGAPAAATASHGRPCQYHA